MTKRPVSVFPNPFRAQAAWDGDSERQQMLWFIDLPRARAGADLYSGRRFGRRILP
jgi:hypothetical protein